MICRPCRDAADWERRHQPDNPARAHHPGVCRGGTWCDCQHGTAGDQPTTGGQR